MQMLRDPPAVSGDRTSVSEKASPIISISFSSSTEYTVVFLFFTPNPVKLFLRDNQCSHTSPLQLINETPLILLLSAFFICLVCLVCLILACPLLFFLLSISSGFSKRGSPSSRRRWPKQHQHLETAEALNSAAGLPFCRNPNVPLRMKHLHVSDCATS